MSAAARPDISEVRKAYDRFWINCRLAARIRLSDRAVRTRLDQIVAETYQGLTVPLPSGH